MFTTAIWAAILTALKPFVEAFLSTFGDAVNDYLAGLRADKNAKDLGTAQAQVGQANATIAAQQAELQAQADAPKDVDEALKRLDEGSA